MFSSHSGNVGREGRQGVCYTESGAGHSLWAPTHAHPTLLYPALGPRVRGGHLSLWLPVGFGEWEVAAGPWRVGGECSGSFHGLIPHRWATLVDCILHLRRHFLPNGSLLSPRPFTHSSGNGPTVLASGCCTVTLLSSLHPAFPL